MKEAIVTIASVLFFVSIIFGTAFALVSSIEGNRDAAISSLEFREGDFVTSVLSGDKGQIIRIWTNSDSPYEVRFAIAGEQTDTRIISNDGPIQTKAFSDVWMKDFEIKAWESEVTNN